MRCLQCCHSHAVNSQRVRRSGPRSRRAPPRQVAQLHQSDLCCLGDTCLTEPSMVEMVSHHRASPDGMALTLWAHPRAYHTTTLGGRWSTCPELRRDVVGACGAPRQSRRRRGDTPRNSRGWSGRPRVSPAEGTLVQDMHPSYAQGPANDDNKQPHT